MRKTKRFLSAFALLVATSGWPVWGQGKAAARTLDFYFMDVEGGAATLIVTPARETVLLDAGWDGFDGREQNTAEEYIANLEEQPDAGHLIKVVVNAAQRSFTITNGRTRKSYAYSDF